MELFAVVCIATSHYVAFVEQNGYNIPEVVLCPDLPHWLSEEWDKHALMNENHSSSSSPIPEHARRLFSDAYMCLYQSPDLMLYR